ncbi:MAG: hypothetical protein JWM11_430 [Planctomycetaceae bacterium]|nr:hypothetical protein [Planctomycetaceae bacterium]
MWFSSLLRCVGLVAPHFVRRVPKLGHIWSFESERLERRALLSAASRNAPTDHAVIDAAVHAKKSAPVFPHVDGTWTITTVNDYFDGGTVAMVQNGKTVTSTFTLGGLPTFTTKATFKAHTPNELVSKSPRMEFPGSAVLVKLTVEIDFQPGNQNPTSFTGIANAPVIPKPLTPPPLATLQGSK